MHNLGNALAAIGAAIAAGVEVERALDRLRRARPTSMRFEVHRVGGRTLIDDSYNANPASVRASVASALELSQLRPLVVCLGDLAELGPDAGAHHAELGRWLAQQGVHRVLATGERTRALVDAARSEGLPTAEHLPDPLALVERAREATPDGGMCLVKGSRVAEMERVAISLRAEWARGLGWRERLRVRAACVCGCGFDEVDGGLADLLEQLEERLGAPLPLTSVCRCARHNEAVGGDDASPHTRGLAADRVPRRPPAPAHRDVVDRAARRAQPAPGRGPRARACRARAGARPPRRRSPPATATLVRPAHLRRPGQRRPSSRGPPHDRRDGHQRQDDDHHPPGGGAAHARSVDPRGDHGGQLRGPAPPAAARRPGDRRRAPAVGRRPWASGALAAPPGAAGAPPPPACRGITFTPTGRWSATSRRRPAIFPPPARRPTGL
ncbi:MAG: hypothetical protein IPQ09_16615 [Myxococcales bacterium]|nr:hypothetical protein [Myxococcales bacterium]